MFGTTPTVIGSPPSFLILILILILMMTPMVLHCQCPLLGMATHSRRKGDHEPEVELVWAKVACGVWGHCHVFGGSPPPPPAAQAWACPSTQWVLNRCF